MKNKKKDLSLAQSKREKTLTAVDVEAGPKAVYLIKGTETKIRILRNRHEDGTPLLNVYADGDHHAPGLISATTELVELPPKDRHLDDTKKQKFFDLMRKRKLEGAAPKPKATAPPRNDEKCFFTKTLNEQGAWAWIMCSAPKKHYSSKQELMEANGFKEQKFIKGSSVKNKKGTSYPTTIYEGLR